MLSLEAHIAAGVTIEEAAEEVIAICKKIGDHVSFDFNAVRMVAYPEDMVKTVVDRFESLRTPKNLVNVTRETKVSE